MSTPEEEHSVPLGRYLSLMIEKQASDIFFTVDSPVRLKIEGQIATVGKSPLTPKMTRNVLRQIMDEVQRIAFEKTLESDFAYLFSHQGTDERFRVNAFKQKGQVSIVMRHVRSKIPNLADLNLPSVLKKLVMQKRGLILMAGATNSGKSTTLAAMLDYRNTHHASHIVTIEDPIEFMHPHKKSLINQRELGIDTHSYSKALRSCMREAPDVILVGEIRDEETMSAALELCNTGHLVVSTLHANNAYQTLQRIVNMFPIDRHRELFMDLSLNIIALISQRLIMGVADKRVAAVEVMINSPYIADLILQGKTDTIKEAMQESGVDGMQTFDTALFNLYVNGMITLDEALNNADSRTNLEARINFGG